MTIIGEKLVQKLDFVIQDLLYIIIIIKIEEHVAHKIGTCW